MQHQINSRVFEGSDEQLPYYLGLCGIKPKTIKLYYMNTEFRIPFNLSLVL